MKRSKIDIVCAGEALIDLIGLEPGPIAETLSYKRFLGGSPTNVAINLSKLNIKVALVASVGNDGLGEFIKKEIDHLKIDTQNLRVVENKSTSSILISKSTATPDFIPFRQADSEILIEQFPEAYLKQAKIFHTTFFALSKNPAQEVILQSAKKAFKYGNRISVDVNYSNKIWSSQTGAIRILKELCGYEPLLKVSEDDKERLFGKIPNLELLNILHDFGADVVCLTKGKEGVTLSQKKSSRKEFSALQVNQVVDVTGAGDAFWSGFLFGYLNNNQLERCCELALKLAALKIQSKDFSKKENIVDELLSIE